MNESKYGLKSDSMKVEVYVSFHCIFLICSSHLSKHPSLCELF